MTGQGPDPRIAVLPDREALSHAAARHIVTLAHATAGELFTVSLAGGSTPRRLYELLAGAPYRDQISWSSVHFFWGDERCVPPDHPDSNFRMVREALLDHIDLPSGHVHRIRGELAPQRAAELYRAELRQYLGPLPRLDLAIQGMGTDGHTASLFPGSPALSERTRTAVAAYAEHLDSWRVTLTVPILNRSRHVLFLVSGSSKSAALARIQAGEDLPAGRVRPIAGALTWVVDQDAVSAHNGLKDGLPDQNPSPSS